jgi:hypothetical protein
MSTTTGPVGSTIVAPPCASTASAPRMRARVLGVCPPGRKLLSGEVTIRSGGTQPPSPPCRQLPYCTL